MAMDPATIAAIGSVASSALNLFSTNKANKQAEYAARHRYQWAVEDMKAAGLNPILAATGGGFGGGSSPSYSAASVENPVRDLPTNLNSAKLAQIQREAMESQSDLNKSNIDKNTADIGLIKENENTQRSNQALIGVQMQKYLADIANARDITAADVALKGAQAGMFSAQASQSYAMIEKLAKEGAYINKQGELVDKQGHKIDLESRALGYDLEGKKLTAEHKKSSVGFYTHRWFDIVSDILPISRLLR
jgi:hypothetical protein